nr:hypothetical protein BaRGS_034227 [Batillaria attramentaria]
MVSVVSGEYSCTIDDTSPASLCVPSGSPLRRGATVNVDGVQAQLVIMETRMMSMQLKEEHLEQENAALKQQLESQRQDGAALKQQLETLKASSEREDGVLHQLETMRHNLTSVMGK